MDELSREQSFKKLFENYRHEYSTLKEAAYHTLRDAILLNYFNDGEIAEAQISSMLNISRTPIREAMMQLANDGLLDISHGRKAKVVPLTSKDLSDISTILDVLHSLAVELSIDAADEDDLRDIEETVALIRFYTDRKDLHRLSECNTKFHIQIAKASKNKWLYDIMERLLSYTTIFREYAVSRPGRLETACEEHANICRAICNRDKETALKLIRSHVHNAFGSIS